MNKEKNSLLPIGIGPLETQVAGHMSIQTDNKLLNNDTNILKETNGDTILKPLGKPMCGAREINFYESLKGSNWIDLMELQEFVPKFKGVRKICIGDTQTDFIELEDLSYGLVEPCIMDIKIGKRTWDPTASKEKIEAEENKYVACKKNLGFCIPGFQVIDIRTGELKKFGKSFGKALNEKTIRNAILMFLNCHEKFYGILVSKILLELVKIEKWFEKQTSLHFFSSSILIIYDCHILKEQFINKNQSRHTGNSNGYAADHKLKDECVGENSKIISKNIEADSIQNSSHPWVRVKMIDFAHVFPSEKRVPDSNYLFGIKNLIKILESFLEEFS